MSRLLSITASLVAIAAVSVGAAVAADYGGGSHKKSHGARTTKAAQVAYLTGKAEIGDGDANAKGAAIFHFVGKKTVCYGFTLRGAATPTAVHIHKGRAGHNGDPVIQFANVPKDAAGDPSGDPGASSGCKVLTDPSEIKALARIKAHPRRYYTNFHTEEFPDGAVRGQLGRVLFDND